MRRLQVERQGLESKMEAEKHVMRAQLRDLMEKQQAEVRRLGAEHEVLLAVGQGQLEEMRSRVSSSSSSTGGQLAATQGDHATDSSSSPRLAELEGSSCGFFVFQLDTFCL